MSVYQVHYTITRRGSTEMLARGMFFYEFEITDRDSAERFDDIITQEICSKHQHLMYEYTHYTLTKL